MLLCACSAKLQYEPELKKA